jgi:hypothetical protein
MSEQNNYPVRKMSIEEAKNILHVDLKKKVFDGEEENVLELPDASIIVFCDENKIHSVCIQAPFSGAIRGIHIGDTRDKVIQVLGEAPEVFNNPVAECMYFDRDNFFRVDVYKEDNRVRRIYV